MPSATELRAKLEAALAPERATLLESAASVASRLKLPLYLVGGAVRDLLMGRAIKDLDLVVEGDAGRLADALAEALAGQVASRSQFGTATLRVMDQRIDLVSARRETYRRPGALPTVQPGDIADDLARRDFTINALGLRLAPKPLKLLDPKDGQGDIARGLIRILHPASFSDDATRILRAVRYEHRLVFRLERDTEAMLIRNLAKLDTISGDRLRRELDLIFREEHTGPTLVRAAELGVLEALYPGLPDAPMLEGRLSRLASLDGAPQPVHWLGLLVYSLSHDQMGGFIRRLRMPASWAGLARDVAIARETAPSLLKPSSPSTVYRHLNPLRLEAVQILGCLVLEDDAQYNIQRYLRLWRHVRPALSGHDLLRMGVPEGPQIGAVLEALRDARLEGRASSRAEEEALVRDLAPTLAP